LGKEPSSAEESESSYFDGSSEDEDSLGERMIEEDDKDNMDVPFNRSMLPSPVLNPESRASMAPSPQETNKYQIPVSNQDSS
jgi:hypothetical protein